MSEEERQALINEFTETMDAAYAPAESYGCRCSDGAPCRMCKMLSEPSSVGRGL